jgi:hypothetical protein
MKEIIPLTNIPLHLSLPHEFVNIPDSTCQRDIRKGR